MNGCCVIRALACLCDAGERDENEDGVGVGDEDEIGRESKTEYVKERRGRMGYDVKGRLDCRTKETPGEEKGLRREMCRCRS